MKSFGVTSDEEVTETNKKILERLRIREYEAEEKRERSGKTVIGVDRLIAQPIMKAHKPKKKDRKIFCISTFADLRISFIKGFKRFCEECRICYEKWLISDFTVEWPPGAFKPPIRPSYNVLPDAKTQTISYFINEPP
jgi:hypothetical protein